MMKIFREYKAWALITGAASGMGRVYAQRLAAKGYNLVLVDINAAGLEETESIVRKNIEQLDGIPAQCRSSLRVVRITQDLSQMNAADLIFEQTQTAGCEVEVLVNNAGVMYCQGIAETSERMLKIIMMVFKELNLVSLSEPSPEVYDFSIRFGAAKTDLEKSNLLRRIRAQMRPRD